MVSRVAAAMAQLASGRVWVVSAGVFVVLAGLFFASSAPFAVRQVVATCGQPPPVAGQDVKLGCLWTHRDDSGLHCRREVR
jgi:hypothetical protein